MAPTLYWDRYCMQHKELDHLELFRDEKECPFCGLQNPYPPKPIVQNDVVKSETDQKPKDKPKRPLGSLANPIHLDLDDEEDNDAEPAAPAIDVSNRFSKILPNRTIANNFRTTQAEKDAIKKQLRGPQFNAGSIPISQRAQPPPTQVSATGATFKLTVQIMIGRYSIDDEDPDQIPDTNWKKYGTFFLKRYFI